MFVRGLVAKVRGVGGVTEESSVLTQRPEGQCRRPRPATVLVDVLGGNDGYGVVRGDNVSQICWTCMGNTKGVLLSLNHETERDVPGLFKGAPGFSMELIV